MTRFRLTKEANYFDQTFSAGAECEEANAAELDEYFARRAYFIQAECFKIAPELYERDE